MKYAWLYITKDVGDRLIGVWGRDGKATGDPVPVWRIPWEIFNNFWGEYEYTHAGRTWRRACEYISYMKRRGYPLHEGMRLRVPL